MKTRSKGMFWAFLFIALGVIILIQTVFKIDLPVMRILLGVFFIYMGVKIILGGFGHRMHRFHIERISTDTESIFSEGNMKARSEDGRVNKKFSTVFGSSVLDLRGLTAEELADEIKIDNAFGKTTVLTDPSTPIRAQVDSGFANVSIRGQNIGSFGEGQLQTEGFSSDKPALKLKIDAAFGSVEVN